MDDADRNGSEQTQSAAAAERSPLQRFGASVLELLGNHAELLSIELAEEKSRSFQLLVVTGFSLIFGLLLVIGISVAVLILCWEHYRWQGIGGLCLLYLVGLLLSLLRAWRLARRGAPFQDSLEELAHTKDQLLR